MFNNFKTVDYSRLATMSALAACQQHKKNKTLCRVFQDFFEIPSNWGYTGVELLSAVGGQISLGTIISDYV